MRTSRMVLAVVILVAGLLIAAPEASARPQAGVTCNLPESDAGALYILNALAPNRHAWDHTNLTVAVQAAPNVDEAYLAAIQDAISAWDAVLRECFDGLITLTEVTDDPGAA